MKRYLLPVFSAVALAVGAGALIATGTDPAKPAPAALTNAPAPAVAAASNGVAVTNAPAGGATNVVDAAKEPGANAALAALAVAPKPAPPLPPPVEEVLRLARSSVGEPVVVSFIGTLQEPFTLNADQVIYLSDVGLGTPVLNALLSKAAAAPPASAAPAPVPAPAVVAAPSPTNVVPVPSAAPAQPLSEVIPGGPQPQAPPPAYGAPQVPAPQVPAGTPTTVVTPGQAVGYETFYSDLSPYGTWVQVEPYGWCWQPTVVVVNTGWQPYCDGGSWVWTDYGWYWQSTYSWGWAPFHYGRWHRSARLGWVWAPGRDWGPAWVAWRQNDLHCGWAPLPPECHWSVGVGYSWYSRGSRVDVGFGLFDNCWFAVSWGSFCDPVLPRRGLRRHEIAPFIRDSRTIYSGDKSVNIIGNNNTVIINNGVSREQVQAHTRSEIRKVAVRDVTSPQAAAQRVSATGGGNAPAVGAFRPNLAARPSTAGSPGAGSSSPRSELGKPGVASGIASGIAPSPGQLPTRGAVDTRTPTLPGRPTAGPSTPSNPVRPEAGRPAGLPVVPQGQGNVPTRSAGEVRPPVTAPVPGAGTPRTQAPQAPVPSRGNPAVPAPVPGRPNPGNAPAGGSVPGARPAPGSVPPSSQSFVAPRQEPIAVGQDATALRQVPTARTEVRKPDPLVGAGNGYGGNVPSGLSGAPGAAPGSRYEGAAGFPGAAAPAARPNPQFQARPQYAPTPVVRPEVRSYSPPPSAAPVAPPTVTRGYSQPQAAPAPAPNVIRQPAPQPQPQPQPGGRGNPIPGRSREN